MLMRFLFSMLLVWISSYASAQDYTQYHKSIIKAEEQIFVQKKITEGLDAYERLFNQYDFVFLHDCMNAIQMALYANDEKRFLLFTDKATKNGLKLTNLAKFYYITKHPFYSRYKDSIIANYERNRQHYLSRLDTAALVKVYSLYAMDQTQKNNKKGEQVNAFRPRYRVQVKSTMDEFRKLAFEKGFPSDKLIGIAQNNIMAELKIDQPDLLGYYHTFKDISNVRKTQFEVIEYQSAANLIYPILIHYGDWYDYHFFDDKYYLEQIKKGNLHPRDIAALNDYQYIRTGVAKPDAGKGDKYYGVKERLLGVEQKTTIPDAIMNKARAKFFIAPIENDRAKYNFMQEQKMYFGWGYDGSRA